MDERSIVSCFQVLAKFIHIDKGFCIAMVFYIMHRLQRFLVWQVDWERQFMLKIDLRVEQGNCQRWCQSHVMQ